MIKTTYQANLGEYQKAVDAALAEMAEQRIIERIWAHDPTVWKPEADDITNRLGWLHSPEIMPHNIPRLQSLRASLLEGDAPYTHAVLLGMGGSSLAPEMFGKIFGEDGKGLQLSVLDTTQPDAILARAEALDLERTLFIVSTKSGGTVETFSLFKFFYNRVVDAVGKDDAGKHFIAITDPDSKLEEVASELNFRDTFLNDPNIGGRYSALSFFGLVPAALIGMDLPLLMERAEAAVAESASTVREAENAGAWLGAILGDLAKAGRDKLTLFTSPELASFGDWVEQLIAESTGKEGRGILPDVGEPVGPPEVYGKDRLFIHLGLEGDVTQDAALAALEKAGHPVVRLVLRDTYDIGRQLFLWEMATAVAGHRLGIHPFDQPNVEAAKVLARKMVAEYTKSGSLPESESLPADSDSDALSWYLRQAGPGDYVAIQAYVSPSPEVDAALLTLRARARNWYKLPITVGYGPRFLHSTGQLHKGDGGHGWFLQLVCEPTEDAPIPDEAGSAESTMTFGILISAQAKGDRQALIDNARRVMTFDLGKDVLGGLRKLYEGLPKD
jgi:glucose-6-phosphate isomerase